MKKVKLIFGTNNYFAPGSSEEVVEKTYQRAYKPFLTTLYKFPGISLTLHYSGLLLEWFQEKHPEFLMLINDMVKRNQVELLGGAYYEPILPLIPARDRSGQIELLTTYIRKRFGKRPRGIWIAEKIWEPGLPSNLKNSGMNYLFLDERHFLSAGLRGQDLVRPCLAEDQGKTLLVFPVTSSLKMSPFKTEPEKVLQKIILHASEDGCNIVTFIEDGEGLGIWGNTYDRLYRKGWLSKLLRLIREQQDSIITLLPGDYDKRDVLLKKRYFPCSVNDEMMSWTLPGDLAMELEKIKNGRISKAGKAFLSGGYFRQFLTKYLESNLMYSKLMHVTILVNQIRGDRYKKKAAREELWKSECHEAYWHGKKGGIYQHNLRKAVYASLIEAEKATRERGIFKPYVSNEDFNMDGLEEHLFKGNDINMYVQRLGGMVFELDYLPKAWNYLDTFTRGKEMYHEYQNGDFQVDRYPRKAFIDHILPLKEKCTAFQSLSFKELGNCLSTLYTVLDCKRDQMELALGADCYFEKQGSRRSVSLKKTYSMKGKSISVSYSLVNSSIGPISICFGSEINLSFLSNSEKHLSLSVNTNRDGSISGIKPAEAENVSRLVCVDKNKRLEIVFSFSKPCRLWSFPVEASWISNGGFESGYQYSCFLPSWDLLIAPEEEWTLSIKLQFKD